MSQYHRPPGGMQMGFPPLVKAAKLLFAINVAVWAAQLLLFYRDPSAYAEVFAPLFALVPGMVAEGYVYQVATYMFLHDIGSPMHLLFNMLLVYFFAPPLQRRWGTKRTLWFTFLCGLGGGLMVLLFALIGGLMGFAAAPTIGFSAAALGMLAAFCILESESQILLFFVIPVKAKYLLPLTLVIDFLFWVVPGASVSFPAHAGGILAGVLLVTGLWRPSRLKQYLMRRKARRHRERYGRRDNTIRGPWLN